MSIESPTGKEWTYSYDAGGNRTTVIDANGNDALDPAVGTTEFTFDAVGRTTAIDYPTGTPDVSYTYDLAGNRTTMSDGAGSVSYSYDDASNLTGTSRSTEAFSWTYDLAGRVASRTYPDSATTTYTRTDDGQIATAVQNSQTTSYAYDPAGNLVTTTLPSGNGYVETQTWDRDGRLSEIKNAKSGTTLSRATITRDAVGNPTTVVTEHGTETYTYDDRNRLTEVCYQSSCPGGSDPFIRYTYDAVGNRATEVRPAGTVDYAYNAADQLTSTDDGSTVTTATYDDNGNQLTFGGVTRTYDADNRVLTSDDGTTTTTYSYDGDDLRLSATDGTTTTNYAWDTNHDLPQIALETDGSSNLVRRYIYGNKRISSTTTSGTSYYHYGLVDSVTDVTNASGTVEWEHTYDPFGEDRGSTPASGAPDNPMRYTGEYLDTATEDYHLRARDYDPTTSRFHNMDPVELRNELDIEDPYVSSYIYANNRPGYYTDPSGEIVAPAVYYAAVGAVSLATLTVAVVDACKIGQGGTLSACVDAYIRFRDYQLNTVSGGGSGIGGQEGSSDAASNSSGPPVAGDTGTGGTGGDTDSDWDEPWIGDHARPKIGERGWTESDVTGVVDDPAGTVPTTDHRRKPGGGTENDPATKYYDDDGGYVVVNDRTGEVFQVSDRTDPGWIDEPPNQDSPTYVPRR